MSEIALSACGDDEALDDGGKGTEFRRDASRRNGAELLGAIFRTTRVVAGRRSVQRFEPTKRSTARGPIGPEVWSVWNIGPVTFQWKLCVLR